MPRAPGGPSRSRACCLSLLLAGCGGTAPPLPPVPPPAPAPPPPPPAWVGLVDQVEAGDDQAPAVLQAELMGMPDPAERTRPLSLVLDLWQKDRATTRPMGLLRAFPLELAKILAERLEREPALIEAVARYLVPGGKPEPLAWTHEPLRRAVAALCMPSGDWEKDIATGPQRARALWVAGRTRLREAIPAIKRAAGLAKDQLGLPLPPDGYGAAAALAQQIVREQGGSRRPPR